MSIDEKGANSVSQKENMDPLDGLLSRGAEALRRAGDPYERKVAELLHDDMGEDANGSLASLVGVPFDTTTMGRRGSKHGPAGIRRALATLLPYHAGYCADLAGSGGLVDYGDVEVVDTDVEATWSRISAVVRVLAAKERPLVVLGGDHGLMFPVVRGLSQAREGSIALISLDAHFDVRPSHRGQPASGVPFRYCLDCLDGRVLPEASTQIGAAGWENVSAAATYLRELGVAVHTARDVHRGHLDAILAETVQRASVADLVWLTLDIDVLDAAFAPGTNAPTVGGLSSHQFLEIVWELSKLPALAGIDVVETSPPLDPGGITQLVAAHAVLTFLGARDAAESPAVSGPLARADERRL
jgi:agmatinase